MIHYSPAQRDYSIFRKKLLSDMADYAKLYQKTGNEQYLEMTKQIGLETNRMKTEDHTEFFSREDKINKLIGYE